jgi:hypothetical protein
LPAKLGVKAGSDVRLVGAPESFEYLLVPLPEGVTVRRRGAMKADVVLLFTASFAELQRRVPELGRAVFPDASLWVAWPKKASGVATDITEDSIRDVAIPLGLVDNKICAVTDVWSGLRLVWRRERRVP